jgi:hypothetical protein
MKMEKYRKARREAAEAIGKAVLLLAEAEMSAGVEISEVPDPVHRANIEGQLRKISLVKQLLAAIHIEL